MTTRNYAERDNTCHGRHGFSRGELERRYEWLEQLTSVKSYKLFLISFQIKILKITYTVLFFKDEYFRHVQYTLFWPGLILNIFIQKKTIEKKIQSYWGQLSSNPAPLCRSLYPTIFVGRSPGLPSAAYERPPPPPPSPAIHGHHHHVSPPHLRLSSPTPLSAPLNPSEGPRSPRFPPRLSSFDRVGSKRGGGGAASCRWGVCGYGGHRPQHRGGGGGRGGGRRHRHRHGACGGEGGGRGVPGAVARLRWPRGAAAAEGQRRRVPAAGPPRAPRGRARPRRRRRGAPARVLPRRRRQPPRECARRLLLSRERNVFEVLIEREGSAPPVVLFAGGRRDGRGVRAGLVGRRQRGASVCVLIQKWDEYL